MYKIKKVKLFLSTVKMQVLSAADLFKRIKLLKNY